MTRAKWLFPICLAAAPLLAPVGAQASIGAGVGAAPIGLARPASAGKSYQLASLYVVNTGSQTSLYHLSVEPISSGRQRPVPAGWVHFGKNDFQLSGLTGILVPITLAVPADAAPGSYLSRVVAATSEPTRGGVIALGARAATPIDVEVAEQIATNDPVPRLPPWAAYLLIGGAGLAAGWGALRWLGVRVQVQRRR